MRIKAIELSWFRGAADPVSLEPNCKSMVVYGTNGSGKSSFVDAIEYVLNNGKIRHLAHEYSGKRQERAIPNTHKPENRKTEIHIEFNNGSDLKVQITPDGFATSSGDGEIEIRTWDYRRTVLRQDEVAEFINDTKGGKYSALLPLLGLHQLEVAAENLRQLAKSVEEQSGFTEKKGTVRAAETKRLTNFGTDSDDQILAKIEELHSNYCADNVTTKDPSSRCKELKTALDAAIAGSSAEQRRYVVLLGAAELGLASHISAVGSANVKLSSAVEPLISEKLEVLQSTGAFVDKLVDEKEVTCPACGQTVVVDAFKEHVETERQRLQEIIEVFDTRKAAIGTLCDTVKSLKSGLGKADVKVWRDELAKGPLADNFAFLTGIDAEALRGTCGKEELQAFESKLLPLINAAASASKDAPPDARQLTKDNQLVEAAKDVIAATGLAGEARRTEALASFIASLEQGIREEIRLRSRNMIEEISDTIRTMWTILHPGETIKGVHLYLPKDADKAIDIGLMFHGVNQESPRLTLSEGYRNSLGLCIFLAMAKREANRDRPLFLDDVVVSLDRNHRGMIVELLQKEFDQRQVVILTHDREWYTEMRHQLDGKNWVFKSLVPCGTPDLGIRWSHKTTTFDEARAQLQERPDSAANDARKIMDLELALVAEHLQVKMPYVRGDRNDKRMAHDFLERLTAVGKKCFQKKIGDSYEVHTIALDALNEADRLLVSWANCASHTFDVVLPEANKLIDICEKALELFRCSSCNRYVWIADVGGSELVQCQCGQIRWLYGKG